MQICEAAGTASALYDLVTHNRLAGQLAEAWDKQHPNDMAIVKACEKLRDDWDKMVWLSRLRSLLGPVLLLVVIGSSALAAAAMYWAKTSFWPITIGVSGVLLFGLGMKLAGWTQKMINAYCALGIPLYNANSKIRTVNDLYKCFGDAHDLVKRLDDMCFEIVRIEMLGQEDVKFLNPFPLAYDYVVRSIDLKTLRNNFREQVAELALFGLTTTDLGVHFEAAQARWDKLAAEGYQMTDFQI